MFAGMAADPRTTQVPRAVRVAVPVRVEFASGQFLVREIAVNLSEGGILLPCDRDLAVGERGRLTLRATQWDDPFTVEAEVVRTERADDGTGRIALRFVEVPLETLPKLRRLLIGSTDGSVVEAIRRDLRESPLPIDHELRRRPADQKLMLAIAAQGDEIDALIRDGNPSVVHRLLANPRLQLPHVRAIVRDPRLPATLLLEIKRQPGWMSDDEVRWLWCKHPRAPFVEVQTLLPTLTAPRLQQLTLDPNVRPVVRTRAKELAAKRRQAGR